MRKYTMALLALICLGTSAEAYRGSYAPRGGRVIEYQTLPGSTMRDYGKPARVTEYEPDPLSYPLTRYAPRYPRRIRARPILLDDYYEEGCW